jgi:hypothetical protein
MFFNEYYFGENFFVKLIRIVGGPVMFFVGRVMYNNTYDRFGIGYGGVLIALSLYYTFKPIWWVILKWKFYKTIDFLLAVSEEKLIVREDGSESII